MTVRMFSDDSYTTEFKADITEVKQTEGGTAVILDKSYFYPTSGGQLHDTGTIGAANVTNVIESGEDILHIIDSDIALSGEVMCSIDQERRFDNMQQHTGQHILSQALIVTINAATLSSSLGNDVSTIDIDKTSFSQEDTMIAENEANSWVYKNVPVNILYPSDEELDALPLRKRPPAGKRTRIINVEGLDFSPCGGTHCSRSGEVGLIKIRRWEKMRGNIRLEFYCGLRALRDYQLKHDLVNKIASSLTTQDSAIVETVEKYQAENRSLVKSVSDLQKKLFSYEAAEIFNGAPEAGNVKLVREIRQSGTINDLKVMTQQLRDLGRCIILLGSTSEKPVFVFAASDGIKINLSDILNSLRKEFPIKGGGSPGMVQGGFDKADDLEKFIEAFYTSIHSHIG